MTEQELRRWALEMTRQSFVSNGQSYVSTEHWVRAAEALIKYVKDGVPGDQSTAGIRVGNT